MVFTAENVTTHVWALPLQRAGDLEQLTHDATLFLGLFGTRARLSADGTNLVFPSVRTGNLDV